MSPVYVDFPPSVSTDVVEYRLYYSPSPGVGVSDPKVSLGNPAPVDGVISVDITTIDEFKDVDGVYDLGLVSVDDAGNESLTMTVATDVPLDFVAPDAPASISVRFG